MNLPLDILVEILKAISTKTILNFCSTDKKSRQLLTNEDFWRRLIKVSFNRNGFHMEHYKTCEEYSSLVVGDLINFKSYLFSVEYDSLSSYGYYVQNPLLRRGENIYRARIFAGVLLKLSKDYPEYFFELYRKARDDIERDHMFEQTPPAITPRHIYNWLISEILNCVLNNNVKDYHFFKLTQLNIR